MELVKISKVIPNENNPRFIKDSKFDWNRSEALL